MLETLRIRNYALIEEIEVDFAPGFNVLTGETGAGKSILVGALNLVLGARASGDVLRGGAKRAAIEAVFHIEKPSKRLRDILEQHDLSLEENRLLLSRTITADGRSRGYACGCLTPISVLAAIGDELVDLHGQHEHQSLLKADRQLDVLDAYARAEAMASKAAGLVDEFRAIEKEIDELERDDRDRARQIEFLRFEVNEIDAAQLQADEEDELKNRASIINNAETIHELAMHAYCLLYESETVSSVDLLDAAGGKLEELATLDTRFQALAGQLASARAEIASIAAEIHGYTGQTEFDPEELETLNQRLALIGGLKRKYGGTIAEILAYRRQAAVRLEGFESHDARLDALRVRRDALRAEAQAAAQALSKKRKAAARKLDARVTHTLGDLGMKAGRFETSFESCGLSKRGIDRVAFLLAANVGEALKPLRQVASGGEVSRIMLALKSVFAEADAIPTLVFDEIDAGVGGTVARKVAGRLAALARSHQVLCITHIPQIAAAAGAHFRVAKSARKGRSCTTVSTVDRDDRVRELARLLDGSVSKVSLEHARVLLAECQAPEPESRGDRRNGLCTD